MVRLWAILAVGAASFWILDASDAPKPRTCPTVGSGLCETVGGVAQAVGSGLWRAKSFFSSGPKLPFKRLKPLKRFDTCQWLCHTSGFWTLQTLHGCFRRSKTSHLLDCGLWALRESDAPKPRTCQTVGSGLCDHCGRSCAGCGLGALARQIPFLVARNCPSNASNPSSPSNAKSAKSSHLLDCGLWALCQIVGHTGRWSSQLLDSGRFRRSKTSRWPDCGLWALRDCGRSCAGCGLGALARQILFF